MTILRATLTAAAGGAILAAALATGPDPAPPTSKTATPADTTPLDAQASPQPARPAPVRSRARVNDQDHATTAEQRRADAAGATRPLLAHLPTTSHGIDLRVAGLAADDHTTVLTVYDPHGPRHARRVYRRLLARYHDPGTAYAIQVLP